jgi:acyl-homoserine-lactone acylase
MKRLPFFLALASACASGRAEHPDLARWEQQARSVTIIRDDWGIPHIYGKTDADAVFGLIYAQAEDDFNRVERNYLTSLGRLAEAEGESGINSDLRMKLFIHPDSMKAKYEASPPWLKALMDAWADGLNYYLHSHPTVHPKVITRFEPWMALSFSEGSIGGDIERISLAGLRAFYGGRAGGRSSDAEAAGDAEPRGSNGIAIAPANTVAKRALLLINPHTSFFFRAEAQVVSEEGLNAYGAVTWGQFFIYQGFNATAGWMHTSSGVDNIDEYLETVTKQGEGYTYRYGAESRPVTVSTIVVPFRTDTGMARREFTVYRTHHGPVVRSEGDKWVSVRLMEEPVKALTQSYSRTKAKNLAEFRRTMELHTNSSNNTLFADAEGNIAYFHANFIPKRDPGFDWSKPVDGSNPTTEWQGVHSLEEAPNVFNPANGWVYNTNNWPYSAAAEWSPKQSDYPGYVDRNVENARGLHAIRVLENRKDFTVDRLVETAYDTYLTAFERMIPPLIAGYDRLPDGNPLKAKIAEQIGSLQEWDYRWSATSVPTTLAVFWGEELRRGLRRRATSTESVQYESAIELASSGRPPAVLLEALAAASDTLAARFGTWKTPWGEINRFQRLTGDVDHPFNDAAPSIPVPFTSARWGSLASFGAMPRRGTKKWYGTTGNSFVAVVEFGDSVRARAVTAGGQSGNPASPHFNDQALRYSTGDLREVYFYRHQLRGHTEREYRPGQ